MYRYPPRHDVGSEAAHAPVDRPHPKVAEGDVEQVRHQHCHGLVAGRPYHQVLAMPRCYSCNKTRPAIKCVPGTRYEVSGSKKGTKRASNTRHDQQQTNLYLVFHIHRTPVSRTRYHVLIGTNKFKYMCVLCLISCTRTLDVYDTYKYQILPAAVRWHMGRL